MNEPGLVHVDDRLNSVAQPKLLQDPRHVGLHRRLADHELRADLRIRPTERQEVENLALPRRQLGDCVRHLRNDRRRLSGELLDHRAGDRGRQQCITARHDANCRDDLLGRGVLQHEPTCTRAQGLVHIAVEPERRQDEDASPGLLTDDAPRRFDAVEHRHANVHEHDVRPQEPHFGDRLLPVAGLAHDRHLRVAFEDLAQSDAHERLIVGDQDLRHRIGNRTRTAKPPLGRRPASSLPP